MDNTLGTNEYNYVELPLLKQLEAIGWQTIILDDTDKHDPSKSNRDSLMQVIMPSEVKAALQRLNPWLTDDQTEELLLTFQSYSSRKLLDANIETFDRITGVTLSADDLNTGETNKPVRIIDFSDIDNFDTATT